jgi:hypothetical protein
MSFMSGGQLPTKTFYTAQGYNLNFLYEEKGPGSDYFVNTTIRTTIRAWPLFCPFLY